MMYPITLTVDGEDIECRVEIQPDRNEARGWSVESAERDTDDGVEDVTETSPLFALLMERVETDADEIEDAFSDWLDPRGYREWRRHVA